jgi:hypothetical protein
VTESRISGHPCNLLRPYASRLQIRCHMRQSLGRDLSQNTIAIFGVTSGFWGAWRFVLNLGTGRASVSLVRSSHLARLASPLTEERKPHSYALLSLKNFTYSSGHYNFILTTMCANQPSPCMSSPPSRCRSSFYSDFTLPSSARWRFTVKALRLLRFDDAALTYI